MFLFTVLVYLNTFFETSTQEKFRTDHFSPQSQQDKAVAKHAVYYLSSEVNIA